MKDYGAMSDFDIDKAVADAIGFDYEEAVMFVSPVDKVNGNHVEPYIRKKFTSNERHWKRFSPSRLWADAGPIIEKSRITITYDGEEKSDHPCAWVNVSSIDNLHVIKYQHTEKTLRAAMIVFLMMQERK